MPLVGLQARWIAGGAVCDVVDMHGMSQSTFYTKVVVWLEAIYTVCGSSCMRLTSSFLDDLSEFERGFAAKSAGALRGCVGAVDGLCVEVCRPRLSETSAPALYLNRKGFYSLNLQAVCDAQRRFTFYDFQAVGSTHDSTALEMSGLPDRLEAGLLQDFEQLGVVPKHPQ